MCLKNLANCKTISIGEQLIWRIDVYSFKILFKPFQYWLFNLANFSNWSQIFVPHNIPELQSNCHSKPLQSESCPTMFDKLPMKDQDSITNEIMTSKCLFQRALAICFFSQNATGCKPMSEENAVTGRRPEPEHAYARFAHRLANRSVAF